ncbi:MAG: sugar-binding protein, partial [Gammaproteobacteria bacterium]
GAPLPTSSSTGKTTGVISARTNVTGGYVIEVIIPWSTLGQTSITPGALVGLDVHINDDDDGGLRDGKLMWKDSTDTAYQNPSLFGTAQLAP